MAENKAHLIYEGRTPATVYASATKNPSRADRKARFIEAMGSRHDRLRKSGQDYTIGQRGMLTSYAAPPCKCHW